MDPLQAPSTNSTRLLSLDFLRGLIMVFLALEGSWLYEHLSVATNDTGYF
jgi:hypothetical protein